MEAKHDGFQELETQWWWIQTKRVQPLLLTHRCSSMFIGTNGNNIKKGPDMVGEEVRQQSF